MYLPGEQNPADEISRGRPLDEEKLARCMDALGATPDLRMKQAEQQWMVREFVDEYGYHHG